MFAFLGFSLSSSPGVWEFRASLLFYPLHVPFFRGGSCGVLGVESSPKWGKGGGRPTNAHFWEGKEEREGFLVKKRWGGSLFKKGLFLQLQVETHSEFAKKKKRKFEGLKFAKVF